MADDNYVRDDEDFDEEEVDETVSNNERISAIPIARYTCESFQLTLSF